MGTKTEVSVRDVPLNRRNDVTKKTWGMGTLLWVKPMSTHVNCPLNSPYFNFGHSRPIHLQLGDAPMMQEISRATRISMGVPKIGHARFISSSMLKSGEHAWISIPQI